MDRDKLTKELAKIQKWLSEHEPTSESYAFVFDKFARLTKLAMEYDELCDKQLERQDQLELLREKQKKELDFKEKELELKNEIQKKELELKEKELELKNEIQKRELELKEKEIDLKGNIESMKLEDGAGEAAERRKIEKRQAWWDLGKIALQIGGYGLLIFITKRVEQTAILGQHEWSLITKPKL